ncbi:MAG: DMT family transporter [Sphingobium sp.]
MSGADKHGGGRGPIARAFAMCCAGVALFSVMDGVMKGVSLSIGLYNALLWRALVGVGLGAILMLALRLPWPGRAALRLHLLRGLVVAAMAALFFWALMRLPMAETIALTFIAPIFALYLAAVLLGEHIGGRAIGASLLGLAGVGVILSGRASGTYDAQALLGVGAALLSALLFAWNLIIQRRQAQIAGPVEIAFFQHLVMSCVYTPAAWVWAEIPPLTMMPLVLLAAILAFTSLMAFAWAYARAEAQRLIPVEYSGFIWAAIVGAIAFGERLTLTTLAGATLIVAGCLLVARAKPPAHAEPGIA